MKIAIIGSGPSGLVFALQTLQEVLRSKNKSIKIDLYGDRSSYTRTQVIRLTWEEWDFLNQLMTKLDESSQKTVWKELKDKITRSQDSSVHVKLGDLERFLDALVMVTKQDILLSRIDASVQSIEPVDEGYQLNYQTEWGQFKDIAQCVIDSRGRQQPLLSEQRWITYIDDDFRQGLYPWQCAVTYDLEKIPEGDLKTRINEHFILDRQLSPGHLETLIGLGWQVQGARLPRVRIFNIQDKLYMGLDLPESLYKEAYNAKQRLTGDPTSELKAKTYVESLRMIQAWSQLLLILTDFEALNLKPLVEGDTENLVMDASLFEVSDLKACETPLLINPKANACLLVGGDTLIQPHYQTSAGVNLAIRQAQDYGHFLSDFITKGLKKEDANRFLGFQQHQIRGYAARVNFFLMHNRLPSSDELKKHIHSIGQSMFDPEKNSHLRAGPSVR